MTHRTLLAATLLGVGCLSPRGIAAQAEEWTPWVDGAKPVEAVPAPSSTATDDAWRTDALSFVLAYYPRWRAVVGGDSGEIAFTSELAPFPVESDASEAMANNVLRHLSREPWRIWPEQDRDAFLQRKHLETIDYLVLNRWTLPTRFSLFGGFSALAGAADRALTAEEREHARALEEAKGHALEAAEQLDPGLAAQMRQDWIDATGERY